MRMTEKHLELGAELRRLRLAAGLTQFQLAISNGVDVSTISRWERGHYPRSGPKHRKIRLAVWHLVKASTEAVADAE
jgi:DNA-binding transcriptional regulator YiaG